MANPIFRFTLSHSVLGSLEISEPDGWKDSVLKLERHAEFHTLIEYFEGSFIFYGDNGRENGGIGFIRTVERDYGFDATITILIEASFNSGSTYTTIFTGQLDLSLLEELENNKLKAPIIRNDLWSKFTSRLDSPVNIQSSTDLDGDAVSAATDVTLHLTPQKINKRYQGFIQHNHHYAPALNEYGALDFDVEIFNEIEETFHYPLLEGFSTTLTDVVFPKFTVLYDGSYIINSLITLSDQAPATITSPPLSGRSIRSTLTSIEVYLQVNSNTPIEFTASNRTLSESFFYLNNGTQTFISGPTTDGGAASVVTEYTLDQTIQLFKDDSVRIYIKRVGSLNQQLNVFGIDGDNKAAYDNNDGIGAIGDFAGYYDASVNLFPSSLPPGDSFWLGNVWEASSPGTIAGVDVKIGYLLRAIVETPGQDPTKWSISNLGFSEGLYRYGQSYFNVVAETTLTGTDSNGFLLHDVGGAITDRIIGDSDVFYSAYLGSTLTNYRTYVSNGCGWPYALIRGLQLRQYYLSDKPFSISFNQWWKGINPILNLSLGYDETISSKEVIRVEQLEDAYNETILVYIDSVKSIKRSYDNDMIFNKIEVGYNRWQSEEASGIDDVQTKHTYTTIIKKSGKAISILSDFIAAALAIETTRRTTKEKSADYKYDNDTFIIKINPDDTSPDSYVPELDENFSTITNLLNSDTRYNSQITPARNLLRWLNHLNGCLQTYITSVYKFVSGEGNYDMTSTLDSSSCNDYTANLSEKQDISVTTDYIHLPMAYEIEINMSWETYKTIRDNRKNAIGISQSTTNHVTFFIKSIDYEVCKSKAKIIAWPKALLNITNPEWVAPNIICNQ